MYFQAKLAESDYFTGEYHSHTMITMWLVNQFLSCSPYQELLLVYCQIEQTPLVQREKAVLIQTAQEENI